MYLNGMRWDGSGKSSGSSFYGGFAWGFRHGVGELEKEEVCLKFGGKSVFASFAFWTISIVERGRKCRSDGGGGGGGGY